MAGTFPATRHLLLRSSLRRRATTTTTDDDSGSTVARATAAVAVFRRDRRRRYHRFGDGGGDVDFRARADDADAAGGDERAGSVLFLSPSLYPHPSSSAAGARTSALLSHFASSSSVVGDGHGGGGSNIFSSVRYGCGASPPPLSSSDVGRGRTNDDDDGNNDESSGLAESLAGLRNDGVTFHDVPPNRTDRMRSLLTTDVPDVAAVVFDRFHAEEAYSFRVRETVPDALRILDMQDVHSLREGRRRIVEGTSPLDCDDGDGLAAIMDEVMSYVPSPLPIASEPPLTNGSGGGGGSDGRGKRRRRHRRDPTDVFLRELSAVHRSDLVLVCSPCELTLLRDVYSVPPWKLCLAPFFVGDDDAVDSAEGNSDFDRRKDFVTIGGFRHPPNVDSVLYLKRRLWRPLRDKLPGVNVRVYGAYPPRSVRDLHSPGDGFYVEGYLPNLEEGLADKRVMLAPLRYGAGVKGKIVDGWRCGLPVVTTPVGSEGMTLPGGERPPTLSDPSGGWGGLVASEDATFVECAAKLYQSEDLWKACRRNGKRILSALYDKEKNLNAVSDAVRKALREKDERRKIDCVGALLWHQNARSAEYFSRWIELKERGGEITTS